METKEKNLLPWLIVVILGITSLVLWGQVSSWKEKSNDSERSLHNVQTQLSDTQTRLNDANSKLSDANTKLSDTKTKLNDANAKLNDTNTKLQSTQQEVDSEQQKAIALSQPEIHCKVGWATPDIGTDNRAYAFLVSNEDTDSTLNFVASRTGAVSKTLDSVTVPPGASTNIYIPGWTFVTGDTLTVSEGGHRTATWTVPAPESAH